jgi:hypothetical protein
MRIGLCLSGQPRTWRRTRRSLGDFFAQHEVEIFLHTWAEEDPIEVAALIEAYSPRAHAIEPRPLFVAEKRRLAQRFPVRPPLTVFDMFHAVAASLELANAAGGHDLLVRARFDAEFEGRWSGAPPGEGTLVVPDACPYGDGCNDQFAIGRPAEMRAYGQIAAWLPDGVAAMRGDWFRPEAALRRYLEVDRGLALDLAPIPMRLRREAQADLPFAALSDDTLFHAEKHEAWEQFAKARFPDLAGAVDFSHASRKPLELDRALAAWLADHSNAEAFELLRSPWPRRIRAIDAFIAAQAGDLSRLDQAVHTGVRLICAMLLQRMDRAEPMTIESFVVHILSANIEDMRRGQAWGAAPGRLDALARAVEGLGLLKVIQFAPPLEQLGLHSWRNA